MLSVLTLAIVLAGALPQDDKANADRTALEVLPMQHVFGVVPPLTPPPLRVLAPSPKPREGEEASPAPFFTRAGAAQQLIVERMEKAMSLRVPLKAESAIGRTWFEGK